MTIHELQAEILRQKKEKDFYILAHSYQSREITEIADFVGDSFALSKKATTVPQKNVLMCGVRFMAETAKILSPEKRVILSNPDAGCPMAEQMDVDRTARFLANAVVIEAGGDIEQVVVDVDADVAHIRGVFHRTEVAGGSEEKQECSGNQMQMLHRAAPSRTRLEPRIGRTRVTCNLVGPK